MFRIFLDQKRKKIQFHSTLQLLPFYLFPFLYLRIKIDVKHSCNNNLILVIFIFMSL